MTDIPTPPEAEARVRAILDDLKAALDACFAPGTPPVSHVAVICLRDVPGQDRCPGSTMIHGPQSPDILLAMIDHLVQGFGGETNIHEIGFAGADDGGDDSADARADRLH